MKSNIWYEVIIRDSRDATSSEPESTSGICNSIADARQAIADYISVNGAYLTHYRIVDNNGKLITQWTK